MKWEFYPWARKEMENGYIDEWHSVEPCYAVPFSGWLAETLGTNDAACMLALIRESRAVYEMASDDIHFRNLSSSQRSEILEYLRLALIPFGRANIVPKL